MADMKVTHTETGLDHKAVESGAVNPLVGKTGNQQLVGDMSDDGLRQAQGDLMRRQLDKGLTVEVPDGKDYPHPTGYDPESGKYDRRLEGRTANPLPTQRPQRGPMFAMGSNLSHPKAAHPRVFGRSSLPPRPRSR